MENCVTVIVPSYNRAHLLKKTIPSYFQELVEEVILIDDCSKDNTTDVVKELQIIYPKLRYYKQSTNMRQPMANNKGLEMVHTEWVYFGDDDSILAEGTIKYLLETATKHDADIVGAKALYMKSGDENLDLKDAIKLRSKNATTIKEICDVRNITANFSLDYDVPIEIPFCHASLLCKSELAKRTRFDPSYTGNAYREETDFIINCAKRGAKIYYDSRGCQFNLPSYLATGGARGKSVTKYKLDMIRNNWRFLKKNWGFIQKKYNIATPALFVQLEFISGFIIRPLSRLIRSGRLKAKSGD